jgi:hypothetical protein
MKFKNFLLQEDNEFNSFLKEIKTSCSEFIQHSNFPIYRGMMKHSEPFTSDSSKTDRQPKDSASDKLFNNGFNLAMELEFGIPLIRKKSYFCSKTYDLACEFSKPSGIYFIFPTNGYSILASYQIYDSYVDISTISEHALHKLNLTHFEQMRYLLNIPELTLEKFNKYQEDLSLSALKQDKEQVLTFLEHEFFKEYMYHMHNSISTVNKHPGAEIMFINSSKYYRINIEFCTDKLKYKNTGYADYYDKLYLKLLEEIKNATK